MSSDNLPIIAGAMLQLFKQELNSHSTVLQGILEEHDTPLTIPQCEKFLKTCRSINGAAKLVAIDFLIDMSQIFENVISDYLRSEIELNKNYCDLLNSGINLLLSFSQVEADTVDAWMTNSASDARDINFELAGLLNINTKDTSEGNSTNSLAAKATKKSSTQQQPDLALKENSQGSDKPSKKAVPSDKQKSAKQNSDKKNTAVKNKNKKIATKESTGKQKLQNINHALAKKSPQDKDKDKDKKLEKNKNKHNNQENTLTVASLNRQIDPVMLELFQIETENNTNVLSEGLVGLENNPGDPATLEALMRASHSIKGAARMIELDLVVTIAHNMEDCFVAAQTSKIQLNNDSIDILLQCVDMLTTLATLCAESGSQWGAKHQQYYDDLCSSLTAILESSEISNSMLNRRSRNIAEPLANPKSLTTGAETGDTDDRILRISARRVNVLMGLSGELVVNSGWVKTYSESLIAVKRRQTELINSIDYLRAVVEQENISDHAIMLLNATQDKASDCRQLLTKRLNDLEEFDRRSVNLAGRLNHEILASRMRPFEDSVKGFPRMVRDIARALGKEVELEIIGLPTQVDRDILEKIKAPLNHIIRNAVDHGIEHPKERIDNGKPGKGTITVEARHSSGMLSVVVKDDGRGVDIEKLRKKVVDKGMVNYTMAHDMTESELLDFLFLPGFSTRDQVTEISGRGVGLDVVHTAVHEMRGKIRSTTKLGFGLNIQLQLPLTLSVIRCLLVNIDDEPYAFPLARINAILSIQRNNIETMEDRQFIEFEGDLIGLVDASQILGTSTQLNIQQTMLVIVVGDRNSNYGIVVAESLGEHSLAVQPLDYKLGKVRDISAAAILNDGTPTLIIDVDDMIRSIENLASGKRLTKVQDLTVESVAECGKRILVVDDSLTVREVERKLLESYGYTVDIAIDGMDGWNSVRSHHYDLVVSDVDMPRMNGIEFVTLIKNDTKLKDIPVMIVSYKDRQEDRTRGLKAGADYYLAKGSFHDDSLIDAVVDLIGKASE